MKRASRFLRTTLLLAGAAVLLDGCGLLLGLGDYRDETGGGAASSSSTGMGGAPAECDVPGDCPDPGNECQTRACSNHQCGVAAVSAGTPIAEQTPGDCKEVQCDGSGSTKTVAKDSDVEDDMKACTADGCKNGKPVHADLASRTPCSEGTGTLCDGNGKCVACVDGTDCVSTICQVGVCVAASCIDGVKNNDESDVDCGGSCGPCADGQDCNDPSDCVGGACNGGICCTPTTCAALGATCGQQPDSCGGMLDCDDGVKNGTETDVDCGGPNCQKCTTGKTCAANSDCNTPACADGVCCATACSGVCFSCNIKPPDGPGPGTCVAVPPCGFHSACDLANKEACDGSGVCKGTVGHSCTAGSQCLTGTCSGLTCSDPHCH